MKARVTVLFVAALVLLSLAVFAEAGQKNMYIEASGVLEERVFVVSVPTELALLAVDKGQGTASPMPSSRSSKPVGRVDAVKVEHGATVKRGDVLFSVAGKLASANLAGAQAQYEQILATLENLAGTRSDLAESGRELSRAEADLKTKRAEAERTFNSKYAEGREKIDEGSSKVTGKMRVLQKRRDQAEVSLSLARKVKEASDIKAAQPGRVRDLRAHEGMVAYPGQRLMAIANEDRLRLEVYLPVDKAARVTQGSKAEVRIDGAPGSVFAAKVIGIGGKAIFAPSNLSSGELELTRVVRIIIEVTNKDGVLKAGMPADTRISIGK